MLGLLGSGSLSFLLTSLIAPQACEIKQIKISILLRKFVPVKNIQVLSFSLESLLIDARRDVIDHDSCDRNQFETPNNRGFAYPGLGVLNHEVF